MPILLLLWGMFEKKPPEIKSINSKLPATPNCISLETLTLH